MKAGEIMPVFVQAIFIFFARILDVSIGTLRTIYYQETGELRLLGSLVMIYLIVLAML